MWTRTDDRNMYCNPFIKLIHIIVAAGVTSLMEAIKLHLNDGRRGEIVRNGASLVILGSPNAGKSSLINVLGHIPFSFSFSVIVRSLVRALLLLLHSIC